MEGFSRDSATEAVRHQGRQGDRLGLEEDRLRGGRQNAGSKYDKAVELGVPVLDEAAFGVLLSEGPDAARAAAAVGDGQRITE